MRYRLEGHPYNSQTIYTVEQTNLTMLWIIYEISIRRSSIQFPNNLYSRANKFDNAMDNL